MSDVPVPPPWLRRVVFVCRQMPEGGGGGTAIEVLSQALIDSDVEVEHISVFPGTRASRFPTQHLLRLGDAHRSSAFRAARGTAARIRGVPLVVGKRIDLWSGRRRLRRFMIDAGPDTVVIFTNVYGKRFLDESGFVRGPRGPLMLGQHHSSYEGAARSWELAACGVNFADVDAFVALTREDARLFRGVIPVPCHEIPNIAPPIRPVTPAPEPVAVALARYSAEKQLDIMIRAFAAATESVELRHWRLRLYGEGDRRNDLDQVIRDLDVGDRVSLMGHTPDAEGALRPAAIHLLTSAWEGLPMSILEASSMSVPTIAFDCSAGVRDLVTDETGALVPLGDVAAFTDALAQLLTDEVTRARKGDTARALAMRYQAGPVLEAWFELFEQYAPGAHHASD